MKDTHKEIIRLRKELFTYRQIAEELGCSYTLPHKVLKKYAPELMEHCSTILVKTKLDRMIKLRKGGFTYSEIASDEGLPKSTVEHSLHKYAPELTRQPIAKEKLMRRVEKAAELQRQGLKNREIAERLGTTKGMVDSYLIRAKKANIPLTTKRKSYPKLNPQQIEERNNEIVELYKQGMPIPDIAKKFDIVGSRIYQIIEKELPELRIQKQNELEKRNGKIVKMVQTGKSYTEIASELGLSVSAVGGVIHKTKTTPLVE